MKVRLISTVVTVLAVSATAACGGGGTSTTSSSGASKTLTYWASNQGSSLQADQAVLGPELAKFQKQTGVKVNLQVIGWPGPAQQDSWRDDQRPGSGRAQHR
jgi:multiple sugar transport system substrate-binding protein